MTNLQWTGIAGIGAMLAVATATWRQCLSCFNYLVNFLFARATVYGVAHQAVLSYMWDRSRSSPFRTRLFGAEQSYVNKQNRVETVGYETLGSQAALIWVGRWPCLVCRPAYGSANSPIPNRGDAGNAEQMLNLWFLRGTIDPEQFLLAAIKNYNQLHYGGVEQLEKQRKRFTVTRLSGGASNTEIGYDTREPGRGSAIPSPVKDNTPFEERIRTKSIRLLGHDIMDIGVRMTDGNPFNGYCFPPAILEHLDEIQCWLDSEKWYRSKGIPWRRGWLLEGPTGTGKSTLVRCIGMMFDLPVFVFDIGSMDNDWFVTSWGKTQTQAPCIILIEDFDAVFKGRENIARASQKRDVLTFDCFLNTISGVGNSDGILLIVTTNHAETLDSALGKVDSTGSASRPGRIDRVIHLGAMAKPERKRLAEHILSDFPDLVETIVASGEGKSAAQFQNECGQLALHHYWLKKACQTPKTLGRSFCWP